jgi:hypothetical protein
MEEVSLIEAVGIIQDLRDKEKNTLEYIQKFYLDKDKNLKKPLRIGSSIIVKNKFFPEMNKQIVSTGFDYEKVDLHNIEMHSGAKIYQVIDLIKDLPLLGKDHCDEIVRKGLVPNEWNWDPKLNRLQQILFFGTIYFVEETSTTRGFGDRLVVPCLYKGDYGWISGIQSILWDWFPENIFCDINKIAIAKI